MECKNLKKELLLPFIPVFFLLTGVVLFIKNRFSFFHFPLDDAWIHRVYSKSFAFGGGLAYNSGVQEAGSTSPLWAIFSAPLHWLESFGVAIVPATKVLGIAVGIVTVLTIFNVLKKVCESQIAAVIATSLFALQPRFIFSLLSGMESQLLIALWFLSFMFFQEKKYRIASLLMGLTAVTRPEALIVFPLYASILILEFFGRDKWLKSTVSALLCLSIPMILWVLFCFSVSGRPLPNTFYVKSGSFSVSLENIKILYQHLNFAALLAGYLIPIPILVFLRKVWDSDWKKAVVPIFYLLVAPLIYGAGVVATRRVLLSGYYWTRWMDEPAIILSASLLCGTALLITIFADRRLSSFERGSAFTLILLISVISFSGAVENFTERRSRLASDGRSIYLINERSGLWIKKYTTEDSVVAVNDAGAIKYIGGRKTIDIMGLNNREIAFRKSSVEKLVKEADWLVAFPSWIEKRRRFRRMAREFRDVKSMRMSPKEYTICRCPGQANMVIYRRSDDRGFSKNKVKDELRRKIRSMEN